MLDGNWDFGIKFIKKFSKTHGIRVCIVGGALRHYDRIEARERVSL